MPPGTQSVLEWLTAGVGLCVLAWVLSRAVIYRRTRRWATTTATIASHEVVRVLGGGARYVVYVQYTFQVDGATFIGDREDIGQGRLWATEFAAQRYLDSRYPIDAQVPVYYDPNDPSDNVLSRRLGWELILAMIAGGVLMVAACRGLLQASQP
jgi:hypothetical protein